MAISYQGNKNGTSYIPTVAKPIDVRTVVDSIDDLTNGSIPRLYQGLVVNIKGTGDLYVLTTNALKANKIESWAKVGEINPADNLEYYQEKLGAKVVDSVDELTNPNLEAYVGMFAVVVSGDSDGESEDESGLYVLRDSPNTTPTNWYRVLGGSGSGAVVSGLDVNDVITFDGSTPKVGTGFSIEKDGEFVEEDYADVKLEAGKFYTSNGINSYAANGGSKLDGIDYITLSNGGSSYIKLNSSSNNNWIELHLVDNTLGITTADVTWVDVQGTEHQMTGNTLSLPKETLISFAVDVQLRGMTETRGTDSTTYTFGTEPGSDYEDVDIYTPNVLPTVYAYSEGTKVRVWTEADKSEIINKISENTFEFNVENHILRLVH